jgi:hypothetical protein
MSQPTRIRCHLARRFSPAFCLLLLATIASRAFGQSTASTPPRAQSAVDARAHALTNLMPLDIGTITRRVAGFYVPALLPANTGGP